MASLTIEELKRVLAENNIPLPTGRAKKEDYIRLYEDHLLSTINDSTGFSDSEENTPHAKVTSSSSPGRSSRQSSEVPEDIKQLSDDDLYTKLVEYGLPAGPVLPTTRGVYEKKFAKFLREVKNGFANAIMSNTSDSYSQFSDHETEVPTFAPPKRSSVARDSPGPSTTVRSERPPSVSRNREPTPQKVADPPKPVIPTRVSYIEVVPRSNPAQRFIEPITEEDPNISRWSTGSSSSVRHRTPQPDVNYVGRWSPNIGRFSKAGTTSAAATAIIAPRKSWIKSALFYIGIILVVLLLVGYAYHQYAENDPYTLIQADAQAEIEGLQAREAEKLF